MQTSATPHARLMVQQCNSTTPTGVPPCQTLQHNLWAFTSSNRKLSSLRPSHRSRRQQPSQAQISDCGQASESDLGGSKNKEVTALTPGAVSRRTAVFGAAILAALEGGARPSSAEPFCGVSARVPSWAYTLPWEQRLVDFHDHKTWMRLVGKAPGGGGLLDFLTQQMPRNKVPLVCLHGGPGLPSQYLESLELLAGSDRQVIMYDQIGCGRSYQGAGTQGPSTDDYSIQLFLDELEAVTKAAAASRFHLFGHGWGGMLALEAAASGRFGGVVSLTLLSTPSSSAQLIQDRLDQVHKLPADVQAPLLLEDGQDSDAFREALAAFQRQCICHKANTGCLSAALNQQSAVVQRAMTGGFMFREGGALKGWTVEDRLPSIAVPTLVARGQDDEISAASAQSMVARLPAGELVTFEASGSMAHIDCWDVFVTRLDDFLEGNDVA